MPRRDDRRRSPDATRDPDGSNLANPTGVIGAVVVFWAMLGRWPAAVVVDAAHRAPPPHSPRTRRSGAPPMATTPALAGCGYLHSAYDIVDAATHRCGDLRAGHAN